MRKLIILFHFIYIFQAKANDKLRYFSEWKVLYTFNGSNRVTKLQHQIGFKIKGTKCSISKEISPQENQFQRKIICPEKTILVSCIGKPRTREKEMIVRCQNSIREGQAEIVLIGKVTTYYTRRWLRQLQRKEELENQIPY